MADAAASATLWRPERDARPACGRKQVRRLFIACALAGFTALSAATARSAGEAETDPGLARVGAEMFQHYCAACHGTTAEGNGPVAPVLKVPPKDLTRIAARRSGNFPDAEIARFIDGRFDVVAHGTREMPVWGLTFSKRLVAKDVEADEVARGRIEALVEYLKTIQRK
jgi:mono/diheme cytochrome c family protein